MRTKLSLDKEGYRFILDGGLVGIICFFTIGIIIELLKTYWSVFESLSAPVGTLMVGFMFGVMFCRLAPIWKRCD